MAVRKLTPQVAEVSVNRGDKLNALSTGVIVQLEADFAIACEAPELRVIILRGDPKGDRCLSAFAGADLGDLVNHAERTSIERETARAHMKEGISAIDRIRLICNRGGFSEDDGAPGRVLVIGWIDGPCLAGGIEFVYGICDLMYATPRSYFAMPEILMGGVGGWGGPQLIRERMGSPLQVKEALLCLGDHKDHKDRNTGFIRALTMQTYGMLNGIVGPELIEEHVLTVAKMAATRDPMALTANLELADLPVGVDCTESATECMVALMMLKKWITTVCAFLDPKD